MRVENLHKLAWRCRRGTRELDLLLQRFIDEHYQTVPAELQRSFETMLEMQDPELYALLTGRKVSPDQNINKVIEYIHRA